MSCWCWSATARCVRDLAGGDDRGAQERRSEMGQDDQVRQGATSDMTGADSDFQRLLAQDIGNEKRIFWSEIALLAFADVIAW